MQEQREDLARDVAAKAQALFDSKQMLCADAVMSAVNEGFGGGLDPDLARSLAAAYGSGLGGAGCLCGAVNGAALGLALILAGSLPPGEVRKAARELHDRFRQQHGSTCCRVLTKAVKADKAGHLAHCSGLTRSGAHLAASIILDRCPEAAGRADKKALAGRRSRLGILLRRLADRLG
jgi:C_GCAxxG_C_C family probable redox protein